MTQSVTKQMSDTKSAHVFQSLSLSSAARRAKKLRGKNSSATPHYLLLLFFIAARRQQFLTDADTAIKTISNQPFPPSIKERRHSAFSLKGKKSTHILSVPKKENPLIRQSQPLRRLSKLRTKGALEHSILQLVVSFYYQ